MSSRCFPLVGGRVMRVTRLDGCGRPVYGECSAVVSDGFVSIAATANIDEGDTIEVKNANGKMCVRQQPCPILTNYGLELTFCQVDPDLYALLSGQDVVLDPTSGDVIGFRVNTGVSLCDTGFALEVWSNVPGVACGPGATAAGAFGYLLYPFVQGGVFGDFTIENDAVSFVISNATTKSGGGWGNGPYDIALGTGGAPGPLTDPIHNDDHLHVQLTEVAPPEPTCGCIPVDDPTLPDATGATAGAPGVAGTWTPTASNRPDTLADMTGITATPNTAWVADTFVVLGGGSEAHWTGTAWAAGRA